MGWQVDLPNGDKKYFDSKTAALSWISRLGVQASTVGVRYLSEGAAAFNEQVSPQLQQTIEYDDDPINTYEARLREKLEASGYRIKGEISWEEDPSQAFSREDGNPLENYTLRYEVEPIAGTAAAKGQSFLQGLTDAGLTNPIIKAAVTTAGAFFGEQFETQQVEQIVVDPTEGVVGDQSSYLEWREEQMGIPQAGDGVRFLEGLDDEARQQAIEHRRMAYEAAEREREMFTVAQAMARNATRASAQRAWDEARKYADSTAAANKLGGAGQLGSAIARLYDQGRDRLADDLLRSEMTTGFDTPPVFGTPTTQGPPPSQAKTYSPEDFLPDGWGSGGGGSAGPTYIPPDRREVEDQVRGILAALVGRADNPRLQRLTDLYMKKHRQAFDNPESGLEPRMDIYQDIRNSADYKNIHSLRPDTVDEADWISQRTYLAERAGMSAARAQKFGINAAIGGVAQSNVADAVAMNQMSTHGRLQGTLLDRVRNNATSMLQRVR